MHARTQMEEGGSRPLGFDYVAFVFARVIAIVLVVITVGLAIIIVIVIVVIVIVIVIVAQRVDGVGFRSIWRVIIRIVGIVFE